MIVVDIETTGIDPKKHSIVSIGAVDFENPQNIFYGECRILEGAEIDKRALEINGFTMEQIKSQEKSCGDLLKEFLEWTSKIKNKTIGGHNIHFDTSFLIEHFKFYSLKWVFGYRSVDLHTVSYIHIIKNRLSLPLTKESASHITSDFTFKYVGLPEEPRPHNGLTGAKMEAETFSRLILGKNILEEFRDYTVPTYLTK